MNNLLNELNAFRATENLAPFADWRKARHLPMLEAYRADAAMRAVEVEGDEPDALLITPNGELVRESEVEEVTAVETATEKLPAYKVLARQSADKSTIEKPVDFVHAFLNENPGMKRKEAVAALVGFGINFSTARTQYQKWFTAQKAAK